MLSFERGRFSYSLQLAKCTGIICVRTGAQFFSAVLMTVNSWDDGCVINWAGYAFSVLHSLLLLFVRLGAVFLVV